MVLPMAGISLCDRLNDTNYSPNLHSQLGRKHPYTSLRPRKAAIAVKHSVQCILTEQ